MPTLNKTKKETTLVLKWGGISLLIIFLFLIGIRIATSIKNSLTPPPPPESSFGKLPAIPFPNQQKENITYSLDTLSGFLPDFSDRAKVYKINLDPPTLSALDKTQEKVARVGFSSKGFMIAEDTYQWNDSTPLQKKLIINIFSSDFTLSSFYSVTPSLQTFINLDEQGKAIEEAESFLSNMSLFPLDLDTEKTKTSLVNTKAIKVDFFQKDIDGLPIYYENGTGSTINLLVGKEQGTLKIVEGRYFHKNISDTSSTYGLKSTQDAFSELKQGKGYIASKPQNTTEIPIKNVFLGYYVGEEPQEFLMPIIIFVGDNDFIAYVSAIRDEWVNN